MVLANKNMWCIDNNTVYTDMQLVATYLNVTVSDAEGVELDPLPLQALRRRPYAQFIHSLKSSLLF